jgi:hypothetical protein
MLRLRDRNKSIPNGFSFYDANLKWRNRPNSSFQGICEGLRIARLGNPGITKSKNLSTDMKQIEAEVDLFNATVCKAMNWPEYILEGDGGSPAPFPQGRNRPPVTSRQQPQRSSSLVQNLKNVVAASPVVIDWVTNRDDAVPQQQANDRAETCSSCPKNSKEGWMRFFTEPVANALLAEKARKLAMKLETPKDAELGVCTACDCEMSLKIWMKLETFFPKMSQRAKDDLNTEKPLCWILREIAK